MSTTEIIAKTEAAGIRMLVEGSRLILSGKGATPPGLIEAAREKKQDIITALKSRQTDKPDTLPGGLSVCQPVEGIPAQRYGLAPETQILLVPIQPSLSQNYGHLLTHYILRQGRPALDWVMCQANRYWVSFQPRWTHQDCDNAAALDAVLWQLGNSVGFSSRCHATEAVLHLLQGVEEVSAQVRG